VAVCRIMRRQAAEFSNRKSPRVRDLYGPSQSKILAVRGE
jgi:hypothetical protein